MKMATKVRRWINNENGLSGESTVTHLLQRGRQNYLINSELRIRHPELRSALIDIIEDITVVSLLGKTRE